MSLLVEQAANHLPPELVNSAAFLKMVSYDPLQESDGDGGPAERVKDIDYDSLTFSPELLDSAIRLNPYFHPAAGAADAPQLLPAAETIDITTPEAIEKAEKGQKQYELMRSWNSLIAQLKKKSEGTAYGYSDTVSLFKQQCAAWEEDLQESDPEGYRLWTELFKLDSRA